MLEPNEVTESVEFARLSFAPVLVEATALATVDGGGSEVAQDDSGELLKTADEVAAAAFSQDHAAKIFTANYGHIFRYVHERGKWYQYRGGVWLEDKTATVFDLIRKILRGLAAEAESSHKAQLCKASNVYGAQTLAQADRKHVATFDQFDQDRWLLNTPGGVVDLRTGELLPHSPDYMMTRQCSVTPVDMPTPVWDKFLDRVQPDKEIQAYLIRRSGYCLTGSIREHMLGFDYGTGRNGKGIFQGTMLDIMADYGTTAPIEILTESLQDRHPTEIARLHGPRAVGLSETNQGRRWDEARLKALTGGDDLQGRFMRQDFFTYKPQFKLLILGNHLPKLRNVDEAIKARIQVVQWGVTIPEAERDKTLAEKLKAEYPGILYKWVQGCLEWQRDGLKPPDAVQIFTRGYLDDEDLLGRWLSECDTSNPNAFATLESCFSSWESRAKEQNEFV